MPIPMTRFNYERVAVQRCGGIMQRANMSIILNPYVPNDDLNDPLATALDDLSIIPNDRSLITDTDLLPLMGDTQGRFIDLLEIRTIETAYNTIVNLPNSTTLGTNKTSYARSPIAMQKTIEDKWKRYKERWAKSGSIVVAPLNSQINNQINPDNYYRQI